MNVHKFEADCSSIEIWSKLHEGDWVETHNGTTGKIIKMGIGYSVKIESEYGELNLHISHIKQVWN